MFQRKMTGKGLAVLLFFAVMVSLLSDTSFSAAVSKKGKEKEAYEQYVKQLQKKSKNTLYYAVINASKDNMPVLLVAKEDWVFSDNGKNTVAAKVYSYSKGEVVYITEMQSTGSGYPLTKKGKYIMSGWHHSSQRLMVSGATGYMESVSGFGMENAQCYKETWTVANGKTKNHTSQKIGQKKAESLDYYCNAQGDYRGTPIKFKKCG